MASGSPKLAPPKGPRSRGGEEKVHTVHVHPLLDFSLYFFPGRDIEGVFKRLAFELFGLFGLMTK